ncbi:hypothetical protein C1645_733380 [Glomus cerebriforme]|uniref:Ion transport domain-containing protein n=1 Tax=Glomus cerebriforme TaxID=658196 RepID=A0A397TIG2_9GLOM|nr:hypothetical protein C1645_733380 [Glomus cerebriforme]
MAEIIQIDDDVKNDNDNDNPRNPHGGNRISSVSVSPREKSEKSDGLEKLVRPEKSDGLVKSDESEKSEKSFESDESEDILEEPIIIKVNDSKIVCYYILKDNSLLIDKVIVFQMSNHRQIKFNPPIKYLTNSMIYFFKKNDIIVAFNCNNLLVYSKKDGELNLISSHELSDNIIGGIIDVDNNNIWAISSNYLFQWDAETLQLKFSYLLGFTAIRNGNINKRLTVISKGNSIVVKYYNEIAIYSMGIHFPIRNIRIKGSITKVELLCEAQNNNYLLAFNLPKKDEKQKIILYHISDINKPPVDASKIFNDGKSKNNFILYEYNSESKNAFGLVDGKIICINLSNMNWHKFFVLHMFDDIVFSWNNYLCQTSKNDCNDIDTLNQTFEINDCNDTDTLNQTFEINDCNDTFIISDMKNIRSLFSKAKKHESLHIDISLKDQKYKWRISRMDSKFKFSVYLDEEVCSKEILVQNRLRNWRILNNNALALRFSSNLIILEYDRNKSIIIKYWYYKDKLNIKEFSGPILPIMDVEAVRKDKKLKNNKYFHAIWLKIITDIIEDDRCLVKYGPNLLPILIKSSDPSLTCYIESIYNKCMKLVKEDPNRNLKFLNIITSSMNDLCKKYPAYLSKFNSEMFMFLDPSNEKINNNKDYFHFHTFSQEIEIYKTSRLSESFKLLKSLELLELFENAKGYKNKMYNIIITIVYMLFLPFLFIWYLFNYLVDLFYYLDNEIKAKQYIVLIVPYINHSCYPLEYNLWKEIFYYPQSSEFVNTCKKEFYTNWNGEAVINFKWKRFGRIYYIVIWLIFIVFLVCFTIASFPTNSISQETRIKLYQTSIAFGFFHLIFELRQFIWSPQKYISIWNVFDSLNTQNASDPNNPWTLSNTYKVDGLNETFIQIPSENTNLFYSYFTSLLAVYLFLTGNQSSLSPWTPNPTSENTVVLFILMVIFSFLIVIYLMNLFIGLLNMTIEKNNDKASYLVQKAEVIAEIELFYLLPHQRRWRSWFPEVIYYIVDVKKAQIYIKEAINKGEWNKDDWPEMKNKILKLLSIEDFIKD